MKINKDTLLFGSFSSNPGNNGCLYFNNKFKKNNINAIYKSFFSSNIKNSYLAAKSLNFGGFAVSMPFKFEIQNYVDVLDFDSQSIGSSNTILFKDSKSYSFNTDWIAVDKFLDRYRDLENLSIIGNGGFSKAVQYVCTKKDIKFEIITRQNWSSIKDIENYLFNATPVDIEHEFLIDGRPHTTTGKEIAKIQAEEQYEIYSQLF